MQCNDWAATHALSRMLLSVQKARGSLWNCYGSDGSIHMYVSYQVFVTPTVYNSFILCTDARNVLLQYYNIVLSSSRSLVGLVATKSHARYLLGGTGWDWVRIPLGLNFSGSAGGVSGHA